MIRHFNPREELPRPRLPPGYHISHYHWWRGRRRWLQLINQSGEYGEWTIEKLKREYGGLVPGGGVLLFAGSTLVGCIGACFQERFAPNALLTYSVILKEHRGRGLGLAIYTEALRVCQRAGFRGVVGYTDEWRVEAIAILLKIGFKPEPELGTRERWNDVLRRLGKSELELISQDQS